MAYATDLDQSVYQQNGFEDREDYLESLKEEYGEELVDALTSVLPPSEDFDGLITELEDNYGYFD
jgi:hypothetical protein